MKALLFAALFAPSFAWASCNTHDRAVALLAERYSESRQMMGLASNGQVFELFAAENGSWTVLMTIPGGQSCIVAAGQAYQHLAEPLPPKGRDG